MGFVSRNLATIVVVMDLELREPTETELRHLDRRLCDVAWTLAHQLGAPQGLDPHGRDAYLARLRGLSYLQEALERTTDFEALAAGDKGATYSDLGAAWRSSRQAARKRWSGAANDRGRWFGSLLRWERTPDGYRTRYAGHEYEIVKIDRATAESWGGGTQPGWHFTVHPDDPEHTRPIGPGLGRTLLVARRMAEVWLTTSKIDRQPPNVLLAIGGGGVAFGEHLSADADHEQRQITVHRFGNDAPVATITPRFFIPAVDLDSIRITWTPALADGTTLDTVHTWREAAYEVADTLRS